MKPGVYSYDVLASQDRNKDPYMPISTGHVRFVLEDESEIDVVLSKGRDGIDVRITGRGPAGLISIHPHSANMVTIHPVTA